MVRIWCVPVSTLDRQHLLGEHAELHCIYSVIVNHKKGYSKHPQTLRFKNRVGMLVHRHNQQVAEIQRRGYNHKSPLPEAQTIQDYVYSESEFRRDIKDLQSRDGLKKCKCWEMKDSA